MNKDKKNVGELAEVLIAISFTTARMAKSLIGISQQGQMKKGGKGNGRRGLSSQVQHLREIGFIWCSVTKTFSWTQVQLINFLLDIFF